MSDKTPKYLDSSLPVPDRAADLLSLMTLREKVGQLNQKLFGWKVYNRLGDGEFELTALFREHVRWGGGIGALYGLFRADPWSGATFENGVPGRDRRKAADMVQRYIIENTRLKIPALLCEEAPHGHQALDGCCFPTNIGMACSFDPALLEKTSAFTARQLRESGTHNALVSVLDMAVDPRWGRTEECFSEDPYLASRMAEAAVRGFQGDGKADLLGGEKVAMTAKHFCAQGAALGGHNAHAANIGERELREIHLPSMRAACKAGVRACMASYNEIDGIPNHSNKWLLKDVLRDELGFSGVVMGDGGASDQLAGLTGSITEAGALAVSSGVGLSLWDESFTRLEEAVNAGLLAESEIDEAVLRILTLKLELGLFEKYLPEQSEHAPVSDTSQYKELSIEAAEKTAVLLKNDGILPLSKNVKAAVIGPNADSLYNQLGDYTAPQRAGTGSTPLQGIRALIGEDNVFYAKGCPIRGAASRYDEAVRTANAVNAADVVILALGGSSARDFNAAFAETGAAIVSETGVSEMDCGEGVDLADLRLGGSQNDLLRLVKSLGKPIVTVLIQGRPHVINEVYELSDAVLCAWYPGKYGGDAVARLIFGDANPCGRLSVSIPRSAAQLPVFYNHKAGGMNPYADMSEKPLLPFGYGLSYTEFAYSGHAISAASMPLEDLAGGKTLTVSVDVTNTGKTAGAEVVQVYVRDLEATVSRRVKELKGFAKVCLRPGETKAVEIGLGFDAFALWNREMKFVVEKGNFEICVGRDSENFETLGFRVC